MNSNNRHSKNCIATHRDNKRKCSVSIILRVIYFFVFIGRVWRWVLGSCYAFESKKSVMFNTIAFARARECFLVWIFRWFFFSSCASLLRMYGIVESPFYPACVNRCLFRSKTIIHMVFHISVTQAMHLSKSS